MMPPHFTTRSSSGRRLAAPTSLICCSAWDGTFARGGLAPSPPGSPIAALAAIKPLHRRATA
jgi:hypothetical protein